MFNRLVCFDLFYTLITTDSLVESNGASYEAPLVRLGVPQAQIYQFVRTHLMTQNLSIEEMVTRLMRRFGLDPASYPDAFAQAVESWKTDNICRWIDGAPELLKDLRAVPGTAVCLVSNATRPGWEAVNERLSISGWFHGVHLSWQRGFSKPDPRCWEWLLDQVGRVPPERCWMVGDNQADDLGPPASMGWNTFLAAKNGSNLQLLRTQLLGS